MTGAVVDMIIQLVMAFFATFGFSLVFSVTRSETVFCGVAGTLGWFAYKLITLNFPSSAVAATFFGAMVVAAASRVLSYRRRMPVSLYLIPGIIPLVPGAGIYYTMYELIINNENAAAMVRGVETFTLAGVIAIGILTVLSMPQRLFRMDIRRKLGGE